MARSIQLNKITVTVATAGTAVQVTSNDIYTNQIEVFAPTSNTGVMYFGDSTVDNTWIPIAKDTAGLKAYNSNEDGSLTEGDFFNLKNFYVDSANNGDVLIVQYYASASE